MKFIEENCGWVPDGFEFEESDESELEWSKALAAFQSEFSEFEKDEDYEFGSWHHGNREIHVTVFNAEFYGADFLLRSNQILSNLDKFYIRYECFDSNDDDIGEIIQLHDLVYYQPSMSNYLGENLRI